MRGKITVLKFGGSSLENASAFERVARIVSSCDNNLRVVVVSAMGGMTDALVLVSESATQGKLNTAITLLEEHINRHLAVADTLALAARDHMFAEIQNSRQEIFELLQNLNATRTPSPQLKDQIVSYGERLSAILITAVLVKHGLNAVLVDARRCILTDEEYGAAQPLLKETGELTRSTLVPLLETQCIPVLGGFFGASKNGSTTTMGRGSSDYTATMVSSALGACETQIWTDVNGVCSADPVLIKTARRIPWMSYDEATELGRFGGKVLHPKSIKPVANSLIPLRVCDSSCPESPGTLVTRTRPNVQKDSIKAVVHKSDVTVIDFVASRDPLPNGFRRAIEAIFQKHLTDVDVVTNGTGAQRLICESTENFPSILADLEKLGTLRVEHDLTVICCVGPTGSILDRLLAEIDPNLKWHRVSSVSSIALVRGEQVRPLISALHERILDGSDQERECATASLTK